MQTRVLLVDDHALFRKGLRLLLEEEDDLQVVGEAGDGGAAIELAQELNPDVVVMDISMPDLDGIEATRRILSEAPDSKIIALSIYSKKDFVQEMLLAGAAGYILKQSAPEEVVNGIRAVQNGEVYLSAAIADIVVSGYKDLLSGTQAIKGQRHETITIPLLTTKLHRPRISKSTVLRPRLLNQLEAGCWRPLTLVSAPAGYGKSTMLSNWLEEIQSETPGTWLSMDEDDNDLRMFMEHMVAAVQTQFPDALQGILLLLKAPDLPPMQVLVRTLVNELAGIPRHFILVLDDYHHIVEQPIHDLLTELLRHPPDTMHLVLSTRMDPPIDLHKLHAHEQMGAVRADVLSFTVEETATFLKSILGTDAADGIAETLTEKTEGWVTGLRLMTLSVRTSADLVNMSTTLPGEQQTLDYLVAEALSHQPREIQAWLLKTSILDRFCAPLCEAVCISSEESEPPSLGGNGFIQQLSASNLFVISLDQGGHWFRYHHLFQEVLQSQLENALNAEEIAALHARASNWLVENGLVEEGITHALDSGDINLAAEFVEANQLAILENDQWYVLYKWLSMMPDAVIQQHPELLMAQAWMHFHKLDFMAILPILDRIEQILSADQSNQPLWGEINFFKGYISYFQGQGPPASEYLNQAIDLIPESYHHSRGEAELHYALSLQMTGKKDQAIQDLNNWLGTKPHLTGIRSTRILAGLYFILLIEGRLTEALHPAGRCQAIASKSNILYAETWGVYIQACIYLLKNDREKAAQKLAWLVENRYVMHERAAIDSLCGLALLYQMQGQPEKVSEITHQLVEFTSERNNPVNMLIASSCQAHLSLMQGDIDSAVQWLNVTDISHDAGIMLWWIEIPRLTKCRVLIADGSQQSLQKAIEQLHEYQKENQAVHNTYQEIIILSLLMTAYLKQEGTDKALEILEELLDLARPGGWIWPFIELGSPMANLLRRLKVQGVTDDMDGYIDKILSAFLSPAPVPSRQPDLVDQLTDREQEVLRLLATTLSAGEIAEQLVVSVNTVRMHTKNIYNKLHVHSRIEAVERAREVGLI